MTGYTVHTGSTEKFSTGWDQIFQKPRRKKAAPATGKKTKRARKTKRRREKGTGKAPVKAGDE